MSLITDLRAKTGASFVECRDALAACDNDLLVAAGWLRVYNLAVRIKPKEGQTIDEARQEWVMCQAREWAEEERAREVLKVRNATQT